MSSAGRKERRLSMKKDDVPFEGRAACVIAAVVFAAGLARLGMGLRDLQVEDAADYGYANIRQSVRRVQTAGVRGRIVDRNGEVLADNRISTCIVCRPSAFQKRTWEDTAVSIETAAARLGREIGRPPQISPKSVRRHIRQTLAMPLAAWRDVDERELAVFSEHEADFPGFEVRETVEREYPAGSVAAHVVGYTGRDRGESESGDEKFNFFTPEMRGRSGLEAYYDSFLRGVPGERKVLVDARGFAISEWTVAAAKSGPDLRLALDMRVQREAERQLEGLTGACAVIDPRNGDVLALASSPGFDLNDFVPVLDRETYARYSGDPAKPLLNRASAGMYAPGSTFKPVTAFAGLSAGRAASDEYECSGAFELGRMRLRCTATWGHGPLDLRHAMMKSCNPFFCDLGMYAGTNALTAAARAFGLGSRTGLDLGADAAGVVPDGEWKLRTYGEKWYPGDLAQMSIGQGMLLATPLQMARVAGAVGTGFLVTPHLKAGVPASRTPLPFAGLHIDTVRESMKIVVEGDGISRGTGWRGGDGVGVKVSGKTGTAEIGAGANRRKNAWFIAYAPSDAPSAALALVVENGESGGATAAPRAAAVLKAIFGGGAL